MPKEEDDSIEPGRVNGSRTRCKCYECHEVHDLAPAWTYETTCPNCDERMFPYLCLPCWNTCSTHGTTEPSFPDQPCDNCGTTEEEEEEEERRDERRKRERERVEAGAAFRAAKIHEPFPLYQNKIRMTFRAARGNARPGAPPASESDALRMSENDWAALRPLVVAELEARGGLDVESTLDVGWCSHQISVFERSWQSDNMAALERGTSDDRTGMPYLLGFDCSPRVGIRSLREVQLEEGCMPIAPAVRIDEAAWIDSGSYKDGVRTGDPLVATWDPLPDDFDEDPREVYRTDGDKTLTFFEFLVWSARVGGFGGQPPNHKWNLEDCTPQFRRRGFTTVEPIGYVPSDWVGRPKTFQEDQGRWHWISDQVQAGEFADAADLKSRLEANMKFCSCCYGPPKDGRSTLILCECKTVYWCSEECKKQCWDLHILDHRLRHTTDDVSRICLNCGEKGGAELKRCSRCENCYFCNENCQKRMWPDHKKQCKKYEQNGRSGWSTVS